MEPTQGRFEVEKFDGEGDFTLWKHKVLAQLEILGLDSVLQPEAVIEPKGKGILEVGVEPVVKLDPKRLEKDWRVRNLLTLEDIYQYKTLPHRFYLKQRFYSYKMDEDKNLDKNLDTFNKLISDLASLNVEMSEEDQAAILLNSFPKRFDHLVHTLKYSGGKDTISLNEIIRSAYSMNTRQRMDGY
ncbi:unnamed protein product [Microthlaspi erraticum]|uniref:Retrotransposon Copia-like N-terminal domain-containing protein n=1 Tax=Microthlaspi erraticum TaxID=1685480 RepID=A0A6D2HF71_9BRAS|nr:unnamed protein product [Microthlaspi erraticum]